MPLGRAHRVGRQIITIWPNSHPTLAHNNNNNAMPAAGHVVDCERAVAGGIGHTGTHARAFVCVPTAGASSVRPALAFGAPDRIYCVYIGRISGPGTLVRYAFRLAPETPGDYYRSLVCRRHRKFSTARTCTRLSARERAPNNAPTMSNAFEGERVCTLNSVRTVSKLRCGCRDYQVSSGTRTW